MDITDPKEMRQRMQRAAHGQERMDGKEVGKSQISMTASLIRSVLDLGRYQGYSGEDTMTILAYHALLGYEKAMDQCLEQAFLNPHPLVICTDAGKDLTAPVAADGEKGAKLWRPRDPHENI